MKPKSVLFFSLLAILWSAKAWSAACCGGGFAAPAIISGDDRAQVTTSYAMTEVTVDSVDSQGIWHKWDTHQRVQTFRVDMAHIFKDRWQVGFSLPVIQRTRLEQNYAGLGDTSVSLGYEYLTDWNYNPFKPKGIGFIQITLPTGKSKADSEVGGLDSRGNGMWALGVGTLLTKNWISFDAFTSVEIHRSFERELSSQNLNGKITPGYGGNLGLGAGYNFKSCRLGSSITWTYEDAHQTMFSSGSANKGSVERFATASFSLSYMASDEWSGTLAYTDQTLFGAPVNTSLGQGVNLQLQRRWGR